MPEQVTGLGTDMVRAVVAVPAENSGKSPLAKVVLVAVNVELVAQLEVVVSHVPLPAADVPLLSHHLLAAPA